MSYFYLNDKKESIGPYSPKDLNSLLQAGLISRDTLIAAKGAASWEPYYKNFPEVEVKNVSASPSSIADSYEQALREPKELVIDRNLWGWAVLLGVASLILNTLEGYDIFDHKEGLQTAGFILVLVALGLMLTILHKCWNAIPPNLRSTTPSKATFLLLIPLFNLYWIFISVRGLADDINRWDHSSGKPIQKDILGWACASAVLFSLVSAYEILELLASGGEETTSTAFGATVYAVLNIGQFVTGWVTFDNIVRRVNSHLGVYWE